MAPFNYGYDSDHQGLFIDIADSVLFDKDQIKIMYHDYRRLRTGIPKRVKKYKKYVKKAWQTHKQCFNRRKISRNAQKG